MINRIVVSCIVLLSITFSPQLSAQEAMIGEVKLFAGNFAPRGWALCEGQLLPINSNQALFSILGTTYGGDGRTTFGLPDLRGRVPVGVGSGPGLTNMRAGDKKGTETNTLTSSNMPAHGHSVKTDLPTYSFKSSTKELKSGSSALVGVANPANSTVKKVFKTGQSGSNAPVNNIQPSLGMHYIICIQGIYPSRN